MINIRNRRSGVRDREEGLVLALYKKSPTGDYRTNKFVAHLYLKYSVNRPDYK